MTVYFIAPGLPSSASTDRMPYSRTFSSLVVRNLRQAHQGFTVLRNLLPSTKRRTCSAKRPPARANPCDPAGEGNPVLMATEKQIAANRRNALKSTGPRTPEGKSASSRNATVTGLFSCHAVVDGAEDPEEFHRVPARHNAPADPRHPLRGISGDRNPLPTIRSPATSPAAWPSASRG